MSGASAVELAPAKVNLTLEVVRKRADGYHDLESLVAFARDACDLVEVLPHGDGAIEVQGPMAAAIFGENILMRAMRALRQVGASIGTVRLDKRLPVAAGVGGGSADVAALLRAARRLHPHLDDETWGALADSLGADVPVCVTSRPSWMTGKGDSLVSIGDFPVLHAVLANPLADVPADKTARVFRGLGLVVTGATVPVASPAPVFGDADAVLAFVEAHDNAMTGAAAQVVPAIGDVLAALRRLPGCCVARMSGAGPTCFALFETEAAARRAGGMLKADRAGWWVCPTRLC